MKKIILFFISLMLLESCGNIKEQYTRTEKDVYTHTIKDTTESHYYANSPRNKEDGVVNPSSRDIAINNRVLQYDSVVVREYPDFIRLGVFEGVGIFGGDSENAINAGIFGVHYNPANLLNQSFRGEDGKSFITGGIYRFGIMEKRLRWFQDSKDWTWGVTAAELIMPDAHLENAFFGLGVLNLTKRWYFRTEIPYFALGARLGIAGVPSIYGKIEGFAELGSIGGLNIRFYLGNAFGLNRRESILIQGNDFVTEATFPSSFYGGLGFSYLDFINIVPETYREWKEMEHSAWRVGLVQFGLTRSNAEDSYFSEVGEDDAPPIFNGFNLKLLNANISIPQIDERLYIGTSLMNLMVFGGNTGGLSFMPIRFGWYQQLLRDELFIDPFIEYNYYPSSFYNLGAKVTLGFPRTKSYNINLILGYASGDPVRNLDAQNNDLGLIDGYLTFSRYYVSLEFGLQEKLFQSKDLKHNK